MAESACATTSCSSPAIRVRSSSTAAAASERRWASASSAFWRSARCRRERLVMSWPKSIGAATTKTVEKIALATGVSLSARVERDQQQERGPDRRGEEPAALEHRAGAVGDEQDGEERARPCARPCPRRAPRRRGSAPSASVMARNGSVRRKKTPTAISQTQPSPTSWSVPSSGAHSSDSADVSDRHEQREQRVEPPGRQGAELAQERGHARALCRARARVSVLRADDRGVIPEDDAGSYRRGAQITTRGDDTRRRGRERSRP